MSDIGVQIVSQLESIHKLGFVYNDMTFQNICYNPVSRKYSLINFQNVTFLIDQNMAHIDQC